MAKLFFILIIGGALGEVMGPSEPPLLIDPAPSTLFEQLASNPDVEWAGHAGGTLDAFTARGGRERGIRAFGSWSGEPAISRAPAGSPRTPTRSGPGEGLPLA